MLERSRRFADVAVLRGATRIVPARARLAALAASPAAGRSDDADVVRGPLTTSVPIPFGGPDTNENVLGSASLAEVIRLG